MTGKADDFATACAVLGIEPGAGSPQARYFGAHAIAGGIVQEWDISGAELRILWPVPDSAAPSVQAAAAIGMPVQQVVRVGDGQWGPTLHRLDAFGAPLGEPTWGQLATVLGGRAPYWPTRLRVLEAMRRWRPGAASAILAVAPTLDVTAAACLSAVLADGSPARLVVVDLIADAMARAAAETRDEIDVVSNGTWAQVLDIAAQPLDIPVPVVLADSVRDAGWREIMDRTDDLAAAVVREAQWQSSVMPYDAFDDIDPASTTGKQWAEQLRLVPRQAQPAKFEMIRDPDPTNEEIEHLSDPHTGMPVIRYHTGRLRYAIPPALPATSPLSQVVMDHQQVWIRVADGTLYPAPQNTGGVHNQLGYGTEDARSRALAVLLERLLDDITAPGDCHLRDGDQAPPPGLLHLTATPWPDATVITRADLDKARTLFPQ